MNADKHRFDPFVFIFSEVKNGSQRDHQKIIICAYAVSNVMGSGFLEKVYENAMDHELRKAGLSVKQQYPITGKYDSVVVGEFLGDLLVEDCVIVELKTVKALDDVHLAQSLNYLKSTGLHLGLLLNFYRPKVEIKRVVYNLAETSR